MTAPGIATGREPGPAAAASHDAVLEVLADRPRPRAAGVDAPVVANRPVGDRYWKLSVHAPEVAEHCEPGQFVMVTVARGPGRGPVLPRPMAVYATDPGTGRADIVYSVVGSGTRALTGFGAGDVLGIVGPLGRGFDLPEAGTLLLGRGIGTCSLTLLAERAAARDLRVTTVASGRHPGAIVGAGQYRRYGVTCLPVHDADGSSTPEHLERLLHELLDDDPPRLIAACGSSRLEALALRLASPWGAEVQVALEAHMACGLGYCHGCSTGSRSEGAESPLICRDGPVFRLRPPSLQGRLP